MIEFNKKFSIALVTMCSPIQCFSQNINDDLDFRGLTHEIGWRAWASRYRNAQNNKLRSELNSSGFENSIFNIIAKGISDCANKKGVFSDENRKVFLEKGKQWQFVDCNADCKSFRQGEWNVILLFNYLWNAMHANAKNFEIHNAKDKNYSRRTLMDAQERLRKLTGNLKIIYESTGINKGQLHKYLDKACQEIDIYATELGLYFYLHEYQRTKRTQNQLHNIAPNVIDWVAWNPSNKSGQFRLADSWIELEGKKTQAVLDVIVEDGKIAQYKMWDQSNKFDKDKNLIGKFKTFKENFKLDKDFIEKQFKDKLLKKEQIHNLCNYYDDKGKTRPIVQDKCYLNSVLQALHASATVRESVGRLTKKKNVSRFPNFGANNSLNMIDISPVLSEIFSAIENGGMVKYIMGESTYVNMDNYSKALTNLAECLEKSEALKQAKISTQGQGMDLNQIPNMYQSFYTLPNFTSASANNKDYKKGQHQIRQAGVGEAAMMVGEIATALATEAVDKQEEPILQINKRVMLNNNEVIDFDTCFFDLGYLAETQINLDEQEILDRKQTKSLKEVKNNKGISGMALPYVEPVIIRPIVYSYKNGEPQILGQKAYKEITQIVNNKEHKYRLIATVQFSGNGGHFRTTILTKDGWVCIDDANKKEIAVRIPDYDENALQAWGDNRSVVIYEPLY